MAIEHTREVQRVECYPDGRVMVVYEDRFDDPDDDLLPTQTYKTVYVHPHADVTKHDSFVQDVCVGAWANIPVAEIPSIEEPAIEQPVSEPSSDVPVDPT